MKLVRLFPVWIGFVFLVSPAAAQVGASYQFVYQLDREEFVVDQLATLAGEVRGALNQAPRIGYTGLSSREQVERNQSVQVRISDLGRLDEARERLEALQDASAGRNLVFNLTVSTVGLAEFTFSTVSLDTLLPTLAKQSLEVIGYRIEQAGIDAALTVIGLDTILIESRDQVDPQRLKDLIGQTAEMSFHLVQGTGLTTLEAADENRGIGQLVFPTADSPELGYVVGPAMVRGEDLIDAQATFNQQTGEPVVTFRLNTTGARAFADLTQTNVGRQIAIVLDEAIISAPVINEPILGGNGQISGNFTIQEAIDLAIILRSRALPIGLVLIEERRP